MKPKYQFTQLKKYYCVAGSAYLRFGGGGGPVDVDEDDDGGDDDGATFSLFPPGDGSAEKDASCCWGDLDLKESPLLLQPDWLLLAPPPPHSNSGRSEMAEEPETSPLLVQMTLSSLANPSAAERRDLHICQAIHRCKQNRHRHLPAWYTFRCVYIYI